VGHPGGQVVGQRPVGGPTYRESENRYSHEQRIREETPTQNLNHPFGGTRVKSTEEVGDRQIANSRGKETIT
jgi:hypothetical protein